MVGGKHSEPPPPPSLLVINPLYWHWPKAWELVARTWRKTSRQLGRPATWLNSWPIKWRPIPCRLYCERTPVSMEMYTYHVIQYNVYVCYRNPTRAVHITYYTVTITIAPPHPFSLPSLNSFTNKYILLSSVNYVIYIDVHINYVCHTGPLLTWCIVVKH